MNNLTIYFLKLLIQNPHFIFVCVIDADFALSKVLESPFNVHCDDQDVVTR